MAQQRMMVELGASSQAAQIDNELRQPLGAACNYVGVARLMLLSGEPGSIARAIANLDKAEAQILRAGDILRRLD